jgi:hypothetical protein
VAGVGWCVDYSKITLKPQISGRLHFSQAPDDSHELVLRAMKSHCRIFSRKTGPVCILETSFFFFFFFAGLMEARLNEVGHREGQRIPSGRCVVVLTTKVMRLG